MSDLKSVTVEYLQGLARKLLSRGQSRLPGSRKVLERLARHLPWLESLLEPAEGVSTSPPDSSEGTPAPKPAPRPLPGDDEEKTPVYIPPRPAKVVSFPPKPKPGRLPPDEEPTIVPGLPPPKRSESPAASSEPSVSAAPDAAAPVSTAPVSTAPASTASDAAAPVSTAAVSTTPEFVAPDAVAPDAAAPVNMAAAITAPAVSPPSSEPPVPPVSPVVTEPVLEGFFVARVAGEGEVQRHHLDASRSVAEAPANELPRAYADDTVLLLARDPYTLFVVWDFSDAARTRALEGLEAPHAVLRVYEDGDVLARVIDISLESRGYYVHGMVCGLPYRVEVHLVDHHGRSRRVGRPSNRVFLPPAGPSADTSVRFLRIPPLSSRRVGVDARTATAPVRTEPVEGHDYITWHRVALPVSGQTVPPDERPRVPLGPGGPGGEPPSWEHLHVRRVEASSDRVGPRGGGPPVTPNEFPHPPVPPGPWWVESRGPSGSSEQWAWSHGPAGSSQSWEEWRGPAVPVAPWVGSHGPASSSEHWVGSHGPAGSSEGPVGGVRTPGPASEQWVWTHGPVDGRVPWWSSRGPVGSSERSGQRR